MPIPILTAILHLLQAGRYYTCTSSALQILLICLPNNINTYVFIIRHRKHCLILPVPFKGIFKKTMQLETEITTCIALSIHYEP